MLGQEPVVVMPVVYWLPFNLWYWCKLGEVCEAASRVARLVGNEYQPIPSELVRDFAALVLPNRVPQEFRKEGVTAERKKIFRYSRDGVGLWGTEVPCHGNQGHGIDPPSASFELDNSATAEMFVPEGWVRDVLRAVWKGCTKAGDYGEHGLRGISPKGRKQAFIFSVTTTSQEESR